MTTETMIPGKDAPLEQSIARMQTRLRELGFDIEEASWLNPVPHVWSVHIRDRNCPQLFTNGKGATRNAALASALGEYFERLSTNYFWADFYLPGAMKHGYVHYPRERWFRHEGVGFHPELIADDSLRAFYDAESEVQQSQLVELNSDQADRGVCAMPYVRQSDQKTFWFPVNLIANLYVSNGMSAGNTQTEARVQGLSEVFERYVKFKVIREAICLPEIPASILARFPTVCESIAKLESAGYPVTCRDASLGGQFPVVSVTLLNPEDGSCFASFGAHPRFEVALERTVTELLQGRDLDQLGGFSSPSFDHEEVASDENIETHFIDSSGLMAWKFFSDTPDFDYVDWNFEGNTQAEFEWCCERIHGIDNEIYIADFDHLGVYACRIIVPGMSEIYPPDEVVWNNSNSALGLRDAMFNIAAASDEEAKALLDAIEEQGFDDQQPVAALIGLLPDAGSAWDLLRIGELKCHIALVLGDLETAQEYCHWVIEFTQNPEQLRRYRCLYQLLGFALDDDYDTAQQLEIFARLYGAKLVNECQHWIGGEIRFPGLHLPGNNLSAFKAHSKLLAAYDLIQAAKV